MSVGSISSPPLAAQGSSRGSSVTAKPNTARARAQSEAASSAGPTSETIRLQHEASDQANAVQNQINQINIEGQQNEDRLKQQWNEEYNGENVREEAAIESEKTKGYERLREIQRLNQANERRLRERGEEDVAQIQESFKNETHKASTAGAQKLKDTQALYAQQQEYENSRGKSDLEVLKKDNLARSTTLAETNQEKLEKLNTDYAKRYEEKRASTALATEVAAKKIEQRHNKIIGEQIKAENRVAHEANTQLEHLRADTARKLAAYQDRQSDPFYKLVTLNTEFHDEPDRYVLYASVPAFEQAQVKVTVSGNRLILSGQRRNEEKLDLGPGRSQSTSSFQSFSESFPLAGLVDANGLVRESEGDTLKITLPKKTSGFTEPEKPHREVARATLERPRFPENLPHVEHENDSSPRPAASELPPADPVAPEPKAPGSQTLDFS